MRGGFCFFVIIPQLVSWVCVTSRPFAPNDGLGVPLQPGTGQRSQSLQVTLSSIKGSKSMEKMAEVESSPSSSSSSSSSYKGVSKIGSSPPSCEHKCFGCNPCEAIQVPATTSHLGVQYTNYEPEGWKCKCGPSFYSP